MQIIQGKTRRQRVMERVLRDLLRDVLGDVRRCVLKMGYPLQRFSISGGKLRNGCKFLPGNVLKRAVILDFRGSIWESLHGFAWKRPQTCSDS